MENKPTASNPGEKKQKHCSSNTGQGKKKSAAPTSQPLPPHSILSIKYEQIPGKQRARINYTNN